MFQDWPFSLSLWQGFYNLADEFTINTNILPGIILEHHFGWRKLTSNHSKIGYPFTSPSTPSPNKLQRFSEVDKMPV